MKKVFLFAAIAALFAACSSKDELVKDDSTQQPQLEKGTIGFDVYIQKATTRAGWAGSLTTTELQKTSTDAYATANGFGVFGYYTDNNEYEQRSVPNFMYNQQVTWNGSNAWEYNPIVYWPNEYGSNATSDDQDKLTFFAYAPYVKVIPTSGKVARTTTDPVADDTKYQESYGITGMTKNTTQGDPILKYIASFDNTKSVDLCWGVADKGDGAAWNIVQTGNPQTEIKDGLPWIDLERPAGVNQKVRFTFKHATAQMRVSIDADIDVDGHGHTTEVTKKTRIWVREVKFKGFTMKGSLNLNNEDPSIPKWLDYNGQNELVAEDVIVYDGRKDGKEGVAGAVATNEKVLGLNPALIQDGVYEKGDGTGVYDKDHDVVVYGVDATGQTKKEEDWKRPGVTETAVNLFRYNNAENKSQKDAINEGNEFFHVIPVNDNFEVEIVYDVETVDANLAQNLSDGATKGSSIENRISKTITFGSDQQLKAGHSYTLALHLGMNSVKFDAAVSEWIDEAAQDVDLPFNTPVFASQAKGATPANIDVTIPYTGDYSFAITGMHGQETMTVVPGKNTIANGDLVEQTSTSDGWITGNWSTTTQDKSWTNGTALQTLKTTTNPSTIDQTQIATWTGGQSGNFATFKFTQKAHPLYMQITKLTNDANNGLITLTRYDDNSHKTTADWGTEYGWICSGTGVALTENDGTNNYIKVERNGAELTWDNSKSTGKYFNFTNKSTETGSTKNYENVITIGEKLQNGDVIKVTIKTGDAPEETVTARYDGMYFTKSEFTVPYRIGTITWDITDYPELKNAYGTVAYSIDPVSGVATIDAGNGKITGTSATGTATVKATDGASNTATYNLEIVNQDSQISDFADEDINKSISANEVDANSTIKTFAAKVKGKINSGTEVGSLLEYSSGKNYYINDARKSGVSMAGYFTIDGNDLKVSTLGPLVAGTYIIQISAKGKATDSTKFNDPESKKITINLTVVD